MTSSLSLPLGASPIVGAVHWLEGTLLGTVATTVAVIAVAWIGMMMLWGRIDVRRGITTVIGCFILFGAASIAAGIRSAAEAGFGGPEARLAPAPMAASPLENARDALPPARPSDYDPYAGASLRR
jgi:type IV secretory pathway VirB2 component (pilin)